MSSRPFSETDYILIKSKAMQNLGKALEFKRGMEDLNMREGNSYDSVCFDIKKQAAIINKCSTELSSIRFGEAKNLL